MEKALSQYEKLAKSRFSTIALERRAHLSSLLQKHSQAASIYLLLAQRDKAKKEDWLYAAASEQLHVDKEAAIATFGDLVEGGGKHSACAAYNKLCYLFTEKRYKDFILEHDALCLHIASEYIPLMQYYLGRSLFETGNFDKAQAPLLQSLAFLNPAQKKNALLTLIGCANASSDLPLFEKALGFLKKEFSDDVETADSLLMYAQMCREFKELNKSRESIKELLRLCPDHPQKETLLFDNALILSELGNCQQSALELVSFLKQFPNSSHRIEALGYIVSLSAESLKGASASAQKMKREILRDALGVALQEKEGFTPSEKRQMRYLLGKMQFELESYPAAIGTFTAFVRDYPEDPERADAYLFLAHCHKRLGSDENHFILNAEKALALNPNLLGAIELRINLFNSYLKEAERKGPEEKTAMIAKAADHLYLAIEKPISTENQRFLAGYYSGLAKNGCKTAQMRLSIVLEHLLGQGPITPLNEAEAVKLALAYGEMERFEMQLSLLEKIKDAQLSATDLPWKCQRMVQFEIGKSHLALMNEEKASETFKELAATSNRSCSYYALAAGLEIAKIEFAKIKEQGGAAEEACVMSLLDTLKNIELQRKLYSEPLHLEAALLYVDIKTELSGGDRQILLEKIKENFSCPSDPLVREYFSSAPQFPEKARLHESYMEYLDAELLKAEAEKSSDPVQRLQVKQKFEELLQKQIDTPLKERIRRSQEAL